MVKGFTLEFRVRPIRAIFIKLLPNGPLSGAMCRTDKSRLHRLKVKVTFQVHVMYPSIRVRSISPESFKRFSLNSLKCSPL